MVDGGHEQAQEQRAGIAHEGPGRVEVVGQEADAHPEGDHGDERAEVVGREIAQVDEAQAVDGEGAGRDGHDPGGEPVEAVDEVDGVGDDDDPQRREQRRHVGRQDQEAHEAGS